MMAEITINQEYIVKINATIETDLTDEEIKNLIPTIPEVFKEMIIEEITGGVGTVDVEPVKHGKWYWEYDVVLDEYDYHCCSCGKNFAVKEKLTQLPNYCPNCGAKMDGEGVQE